MELAPRISEIVQEVRAGLEGLYGPRLVGLILYGSQARGEATEGSDIDLLVVLDDFREACEELEQMASLGSSLSLEHDVAISFFPVREHDFRSGGSPLLLNVAREGVAV